MSDYLIRRGGRYSFRRRYPIDVAAILGKVEFVKALGTADRREAEKLARVVNVNFDNICEESLRGLARAPAEPSKTADDPGLHQSDEEVTRSVLARLPGIIRTMTESVIAEQSRNRAGWADVISWQRRSLEAQVAGQMPASVAKHPLEARAALEALEAAARGEPMNVAGNLPTPSPVAETPPIRPVEKDSLLDREKLNAAFEEYALGKSPRRVALALRQTNKVLHLPCSREEAVAAITKRCTDELSKDKKRASIWTEASAVIAVLKHVPGWHNFEVPKVGALKQLKGAGRASQDARSPMPVSVLHTVLGNLPKNLPRGGGYWHASLLLCALYGLRPGELLRSGSEALQVRKDVFDVERLVFKVGLNGAKTVASKRDPPVPDELRPLFELALSKGSCSSETARTRVERLNRLVQKSQSDSAIRHTLYTVRHLFADVARSCNYSEDQFGPLFGHTSKADITRVYGGKAPLDFNSELLSAVQHKLFPLGLADFWPAELRRPKPTP